MNYPQATNDKEMKQLLAKGPVIVSVATSDPTHAWSYYENGIFSGPCSTQTDHAVIVVGYTEDYWIIQNSWGVNWGMNGYMHLKMGNTCGVLSNNWAINLMNP